MEKISEAFRKQREHHPEIKRTTAEERIEKIRRLRDAMLEKAPQLREAIYADYRKSPAEIDLTEIFPVVAEANHAIRNLKKWMRSSRVSTPKTLLGTSSEIRYEPKGVVLVIGPWNYPFSLVINPLISAIAAGNCVAIKPSELTANTSAFLKGFLEKLFDPREVAVFEGDATVTTRLLAEPFDHIFFTGSPRVGKIVMEAAAKHLSSVTLELGGKSPAILDSSADLRKAADRLVVGKFINAGQTCVAPDYVYVPASLGQAFLGELKSSIARHYGETEDARKKSPDLCRVINGRNFERIKKLVDESVARGARVVVGGVFDAAERYIAPTVLSDVKLDTPIMSEEIFGPVLPVLAYDDLSQVYRHLRSQGAEKPLALYIFSENARTTEDILANTTAGGTCVNQAILHLANPNLPFGGTGYSGVGNYHGLFGFKAFSHERAVLRQGRFDAFKMLNAPYTPKVVKMIERVTRFLA
ncbi:MAG: aldehyde dehydrogenase family protein [Deltaproteobacteria bacterium]|nr:aldehyde dehydrogenase family protein [Deltaproteobacteria bacterium]